MFRFTGHIRQRMLEREISSDEILLIVNKEVEVVVYPSSQDKEIDLYFGKVNKKYILVVVDRQNNNLITVRKMRDKEKIIYEEDIKNEK